jgi:predicted GNAT family N-acyltransferase
VEVVLAEEKAILEKVFSLRRKVFVKEQGVPPKLEWDEEDSTAIHAAVLHHEEVIGTGRLVVKGNSGRIGRMAVSKEWRGKGVGSLILRKLVEMGIEKRLNRVYLHSQLHAKPFYLKHGFKPIGEIFEEAGIPHQEMVLFLTLESQRQD